jgi:hypothetical protein
MCVLCMRVCVVVCVCVCVRDRSFLVDEIWAWGIGGVTMTREPQSTQRKACTNATVSTKNPTRPGLEWSSGLWYEWDVTIRVSHGSTVGELERMWKESGCEVIYGNLPGCSEGNREKLSQQSRSVSRDLNSRCTKCEAALQSSASRASSV